MKVETVRRVAELGAAAAAIVVWRATSTRRRAGEFNRFLSTGAFNGEQKAAITAGLPGRVAKRMTA